MGKSLSPEKREPSASKRAPRATVGVTLLEMVVALTVVSVLTLVAVPLVKVSIKRHRERQLREALGQIRSAIEAFRRDSVGMPCQGEPGTYGWQMGESTAFHLDPRSRVVISDCGLFTQENPDRYPPSLEILVQGVAVVPRGANLASLGSGQSSAPTLASGSIRSKKYLSQIPVDPMTGKREWGLRSSFDPPGASSWGGENVFTVYSTSTDTALSGEKYRDW